MVTSQIWELLHEYINKADERLSAHEDNPLSGSSWLEAKTRIKNQL